MTSSGSSSRFHDCIQIQKLKQIHKMKTKLMTLLIVAIGFVAINANGQAQDESRVKIVTTSTPGIIKLIHAISTDEPVTVKFINDDGIVLSDEITGAFPKGLSKRYDVSELGKKAFRMEVSSTNLVVTYKIVPNKDKKLTAYLEKAERNYLLASN
jgi:hypothetical protein